MLVANILAGPLVELAPRLAALVAPGGSLALSGVLEAQAAAVVSAYRTDFDLAPPRLREDWTLIAGRRHVPMPLTTRCRHCGRLFPVYATQLKAKRARVPCPQCGKRFDAVAGLIDEHVPALDEATRRRHPAHRTTATPAVCERSWV